jgi:hypothetical protein
MNRKEFLKLSALTACVLTIGGGGVYLMTRDPDILEDHFEGTEKALAMCFAQDRVVELMDAIRQANTALAPQMPYIGGGENLFTEWLTFGVYYLAVYQVLKAEGLQIEDVGRVIYDAFQSMADYPKWMLSLVSRLKYSEKYVRNLKAAAAITQERRYPGDWVATFIEGDGDEFDYGLDITECGICKFYRAQGAEELTPYMCLSDFVISNSLERGLVRYHTLAEGSDVCDFRFKRGRATYVSPLRDGWPPKFS